MVWFGMVWFDVLGKTPGLHLVHELRYPWFGLVWYGMVWYGLVWFDVLAKTPGLYLVPELRYPWFGLVWYGIAWYRRRSRRRKNTTVLVRLCYDHLIKILFFV